MCVCGMHLLCSYGYMHAYVRCMRAFVCVQIHVSKDVHVCTHTYIAADIHMHHKCQTNITYIHQIAADIPMHEASAPQISTLLNLLQQYQAAPPPRMVVPTTVPSTPTRAGSFGAGGGEPDAAEAQLTPRFASTCAIYYVCVCSLGTA